MPGLPSGAALTTFDNHLLTKLHAFGYQLSCARGPGAAGSRQGLSDSGPGHSLGQQSVTCQKWQR